MFVHEIDKFLNNKEAASDENLGNQQELIDTCNAYECKYEKCPEDMTEVTINCTKRMQQEQ